MSTRPLSGMPVGRIQSNALMRSVLTSSNAVAKIVDIAHFAAANGQVAKLGSRTMPDMGRIHPR